jgi:hypothetical protein
MRAVAMSLVEDTISLEPSNAHRLWRLMSEIIEAHPEWADAPTFEAARAKMVRLGLRAGYTLDELFALKDAKSILSLWRTVVAIENDLWE